MARRKNRPETVQVKCHLSERLRDIRMELYGDRGGSEMARRLGVPIRTWYNYESGVTVPAEVLLRFMELTSVEPLWLLHGRGPKFRTIPPTEAAGDADQTVRSLLRTALKHLESRKAEHVSSTNGHPEVATAIREPRDMAVAARPQNAASTGRVDARDDWLIAEREGRCLAVHDDAMTPIVAKGARVAYARDDDAIETLDGSLVVAWIEGQPVVRWLRISGGFALLRAENPDFSPSLQLIDLAAPHRPRVRRVQWIGTPH